MEGDLQVSPDKSEAESDEQDAACNNCGSRDKEVLYPAGFAQVHRIVKCRACGLMFAHPTGAGNLRRYAGVEPLGASRLTDSTPSVIRSYDKLPDYLAIDDTLIEWYPNRGTLLEVGCHAGVLLDGFRQKGWSCLGVEPDRAAADYARERFGLEVIPRTIEDSGIDAGSVDVALLLHVVEHLDNPIRTVSAIRNVLKPGGMLVLETPIYDSLMFRLLGRRERSISCDGHVYFYTTSTLETMLERCGLRVKRARRVGRTVSIARLLWNVGVMSKSPGARRAIDRVNSALDLDRRGIRLYLNTRDMLRVYCQPV